MSKLGFLFAGIFLALSVLLVSTQGIFGESFIVIILGMPWSLIPAFFEFGDVSTPVIYLFVLVPVMLNALILYAIGHWVSGFYDRKIVRS